MPISSATASDIDKDLAVADAKLDALRTQGAQYDALISQFEELKASVTREMGSLEQKKRDLEALRLPINWLPNEILGQIFLFFVQKEWRNGVVHNNLLDSPITVSHVSQWWRAVALSTPHVWSYIYLRGRWRTERLRMCLSRSLCTPLDLSYDSGSQAQVDQVLQATSLVKILDGKLNRLRRLTVHTKYPDTLLPFVNALNEPDAEFPELVSLSLSITTLDPRFSVDGLLKNNLPDQAYSIPKSAIPSWSHLTYLKLEQLPPFNLPYHFIANLTSLELSYPPRKARPTRAQYDLKLSAFLRLLGLTTHLEELILSNTRPVFDVSLPDDSVLSNPTTQLRMPPVKLARLKVINWTFPFPGEIHQFMSHIEVPVLEKLDVWVENKLGFSWRDEQPYRGTHSSSRLPVVIDLPVLEDLTFQCPADDSSISSLRKFHFPNLQRLDIVNTSPDGGSSNASKKRAGDETLLTFPRIESIFRDPRLFSLTRLTLSQFEFSAEQGRSEAVLGYMPALISLSLEACLGAANLIKVLGERCALGLPGAKRLQRAGKGGVRVCPRLEALSFWGCDDLTPETLAQIVLARNGGVGEAATGLKGGHEAAGGASSVQPPSRTSEANPHTAGGAGAVDVANTTITGSELPSGKGTSGTGASRGTSIDNTAASTRVMGRWIKPLRRTAVRQVSGGATSGAGGPHPGISVDAYSIASMAHEVTVPSPIVYVRIQDCPLFKEHDSRKLKNSGVADVVWLGVE